MSKEFKPLVGGKYNYGAWRTDIPREDGYSPEMISADFHKVQGTTTMDKLEYFHEGCDTLYKAFERNVKRIPNHPMLGTMAGEAYEW
jgi:hypothetical protein